MRIGLVALIVSGLLAAAQAAGPARQAAGDADGRRLRDADWTAAVHRVALDNGLTLLLLRRGTLPIVSVEALYKVGSRNERPGLTGAAHFIEHMAFRRTERINKADLTNQVLRWGGRWGGYTSYDQTVYNAHAPSAYLDWLLFTERQRLGSVLFDPESVNLERTSVISELHEYENSPAYILSEHRLRRTALVAHPYGSPIMGWISDLENVTAAELEGFYRRYYAANNLVLAIVGQFDEAEALALVHKHFDDAAGAGQSTRLRTVEPDQTGPRRVVHRGPGSASHLELLLHAPAAADPRYPQLLVLDAVLAGGKAEGREPAWAGSRLDRAVVESGLARQVSTEIELSEYPGLYAIGIDASADADLARIEAALGRALAAASTDISDVEVRTAVQEVLSAFTLRDDSNRAIADRRARFEGIGGYERLRGITDRVARVTTADVRRLATELFADDRHNVGWFVPTLDGGPETPAATTRESGSVPPPVVQRHAGTVTPPPAQLDVPALPALSLSTLPNGLAVGVAPLGGDVVHVRVRVDAGAVHDPDGLEGLALLTARALDDAAESAGTLASRGVTIAGSTAALDEAFDNRMFVEWTASLRPADLQAVLSALAARLERPSFDASRLSGLRDGLAAETAALQDDSRWQANQTAWRALFSADHPLGRPVEGTNPSRDAIDAEAVASFHRTYYGPARTIVALSGAVAESAVLQAVRETLGQWQPAADAAPRLSAAPWIAADWPLPASGDGRTLQVSMPHKAQASLTVAAPAVGPAAADYPALSLLNYLLGETGYAGRLGEQLVDTGIAYAVYASLWPHRGAGPLLVTTDAVRSAEAVTRIRETMAAFAERGVTAAELAEAKGFVLGRLLFRFERPAAASAAVADLASLGEDADGLEAFGRRVRAVTLEQVNAAARQYYDPRRAVFVVAGR